MLEMNPNDWIQIGVYVGGLVVAVAILKNDIKWLGKNFDEHRQDDLASFKRLEDDIRDLRKELK